MDIGKRLRHLREERSLSQGDIETRTGLCRSYVSRVESGHLVPGLQTLERFAVALDVPLFWLFHPGTENVPSSCPSPRPLEDAACEAIPGSKERRFLLQIRPVVQKLAEPDRELLLALADRLATRNRPGRPTSSPARVQAAPATATVRPPDRAVEATRHSDADLR